MNILVTGANGQLGCELRLLLSGSEDKVFFTDIRPIAGEDLAMIRTVAPRKGEGVDADTVILDITDAEAVRSFVEFNKIDVIVNCAGYTNVDAAEDDSSRPQLLNAVAPGILAAAICRNDGLLIHISTDYVFGGEPAGVPIHESAKPCPLGLYGRTKMEGEIAVKTSGCHYLIFRTAWLYSEFGHNFVKTILSKARAAVKADKLAADASEGAATGASKAASVGAFQGAATGASKAASVGAAVNLKVVSDQIGTPTYACNLAKTIVHVLDTEELEDNATVNFTDSGVCSWYDFAVQIVDNAGLADACKVHPCNSSEYTSKAKRPAYSVLDKTKLRDAFGIVPPHWTHALKDCMNKMQSVGNEVTEMQNQVSLNQVIVNEV